MLARALSRAAWKSVASVLLLAGVGAGAALSTRAANATTVAIFTWVATGPGPNTTANGTLTLSLPDSITTQTFDTGTLTSSAAAAMLTGLSFQYGNGLSVTLGDLTSKTINPIKWYTSAATNSNGLPDGVYLLAGFQLTGSKVFPGDPRAAIFTLTNPAGSQLLPGPSNVGLAGAGLTPFVGNPANDSGHWLLTSFVPAVPLPAALPLLLSGLAGLGGVVARRGRAEA